MKQEKQRDEASSIGVSEVSADGSPMSSPLGNVSNTFNTAPIKALALTRAVRTVTMAGIFSVWMNQAICRGGRWLMFPRDGDGNGGGVSDQMAMGGGI